MSQALTVDHSDLPYQWVSDRISYPLAVSHKCVDVLEGRCVDCSCSGLGSELVDHREAIVKISFCSNRMLCLFVSCDAQAGQLTSFAGYTGWVGLGFSGLATGNANITK